MPAELITKDKARGPSPYPEFGEPVPDDGWHLWLDHEAKWAEDEIFLPEDVAWRQGILHGKSKPLPVNAPSGGWNVLNASQALAITLPTSVEQHFWGKFGSRSYTPEEYRYAAPKKDVAPPADDDVPQNGAYFGVSWWFREVAIPESMRGKRIFLHIRGAHLRAEVYLNGKLCGYSIMEELPFEADLTAAAEAGGRNLLAIRITNPFGRFDWVDGLNASWGAVSLFRSHGFGALDRGMTISSCGAVRIKDAWVLNQAEPRAVRSFAVVDELPPGQDLTALFEVIDPATGKILCSERTPIERSLAAAYDGVGNPLRETVDSRSSGYIASATLHCPDAQIWELASPRLYHLRSTVSNSAGDHDVRTTAFGFRWFAPEGVGKDAIFRLNGKRTRIYTSISWGFWGLNGMFPVPELAEKEVRAAKELGLNCLNFHRNLAKEDVLRQQDRLGLLRHLEPGGGKMALGKVPPKIAANSAGITMVPASSPADRFAMRFTFVKCVLMVKAFRSHPSVIEYCLQNELGADLSRPETLAVLHAMHEQDPSRCVVLNDGFVQRGAAQAWYEPWNETVHRSDKETWGGWWNDHQGAGDQWYDEFYKSPSSFTYKAPYKNVLTEYGEMEGCARPDIHGLMLHQITGIYKKYGGDSYDLVDHSEIVKAYDSFLSRWGFRKAFPTADSVFQAVGRTCYESWMNYMENARISDELDYAAISGWESTAIENHSGIVDNLRNFKSDPALIGDTLLPVRPIAKQRALSIALGKPAVFDLYLANDSSRPATGTLEFAMVTPGGRREVLKRLSVAAQTPDKFSYLLEEGFHSPVLNEEGRYRFHFSLSSVPLATQKKEIWVVGPHTSLSKNIRVGISGIPAMLRVQLQQLAGVEVAEFERGGHFDLIVSAGMTARTQVEGQVGETTGEQLPVIKPGHTPEPGETAVTTQSGHLAAGILEAVRTGTPLLAIPQMDTLSDGLARELADAGAFQYHGAVGDFRAPWMGNWYFVREHALFEGLPVNAALGGFYQVKGRQSNGLVVDSAQAGAPLEIVVGYSRDHDRRIGAGTFTTQLGKGKLLFHRVPDFHPVLQQRFLSNAIHWLTA